MKDRLRIFYLTSRQIQALLTISAFFACKGIIGKAISILLDNIILHLYGMEVTASSLDIKRLIIGHSTGVVLGGNGIRCTGTLHISSGVVFARRYHADADDPQTVSSPLFTIDGDLTVGANSVLMGPLSIKGPVLIGALSLVTRNITEPGVYVGAPAKKIRDLPAR